MERIQGVVERITFQNEESGYTVARFQPEGRREPVTVVGNTLSLTAGECVALKGEWTNPREVRPSVQDRVLRKGTSVHG